MLQSSHKFMASDHGSSGTKATFFSMRKFRMQKCGEMIRESFLFLQGPWPRGKSQVPHLTSTSVVLLWPRKGCGCSIPLVLFSKCSFQVTAAGLHVQEANQPKSSLERTTYLECPCGAEVALQLLLWRIPGLQASKCFSTPHLPLVTQNTFTDHIQE